MFKKIFLIAMVLLISIPVIAQAQDADNESTGTIKYQWESNLGKLRADSGRPNIYIFDTYDGMTVGSDKENEKDVSVGWNERTAEKISKKLTKKAFDIHQRLTAIKDVGAVFIGYRVIMVQTFPLVRQDPLPQIKEVLQ